MLPDPPALLPRLILYVRIQKTGSSVFSATLAQIVTRAFNSTPLECGWSCLRCHSRQTYWADEKRARARGDSRPCSEGHGCLAPDGPCGRQAAYRPGAAMLLGGSHVDWCDAARLAARNPFGALPHPARQVLWLTWLRHPFERTLSEFSHPTYASALGPGSFAGWCATGPRPGPSRSTVGRPG